MTTVVFVGEKNPQTNGSQCFLGEWWSACPHGSHFSLEGLGGGKAADTGWERGFPESYVSLMTACRGCIIKQVQDKWCIVILIKQKAAWLPQVSILSFHFNAIFEPFSDIHLLETHLGETSSLLFLLSTEENMIQVWKRLKRTYRAPPTSLDPISTAGLRTIMDSQWQKVGQNSQFKPGRKKKGVQRVCQTLSVKFCALIFCLCESVDFPTASGGWGWGDVKVQNKFIWAAGMHEAGESSNLQCRASVRKLFNRVREGKPMPPLTAQSGEYKEDIRVRLKQSAR